MNWGQSWCVSAGSSIGTNVPLWWGNINKVGGYARLGTRGKWEICVPFSPFFCEPKTPILKK